MWCPKGTRRSPLSQHHDFPIKVPPSKLVREKLGLPHGSGSTSKPCWPRLLLKRSSSARCSRTVCAQFPARNTEFEARTLEGELPNVKNTYILFIAAHLVPPMHRYSSQSTRVRYPNTSLQRVSLGFAPHLNIL